MPTFAQLKTAAEVASSTVELFKIAKSSNDKLLANIAKARLLAYTPGRAVEAGHYFENVSPGWSRVNDEIHDLLKAKMSGLTAEQVVAIIKEATS